MNIRDEQTRAVQSLYDEQVSAWVIFDENDGCRICGAQVREFSQVLHHRWHLAMGQELEDE